jgi:perosamine synthetase
MISHSNTFIANNEIHAIDRVVKSGYITAGEENRLFRNEFSEYLGAEYVKLTGSGTLAFFLILKALGVQIGDEVLLPDYICKDLLGPIIGVGARVVIYDNKENSWLSSEAEILSKVTSSTKVVLVNHTFGFRFNDINTLSSKLPSAVKIVEDCCHAIFSKRSLESLNVRSNSLCSFYSFNATKLLAAGEGGAISTNDEAFFKELQKIDIGDRVSDISCALARTQLKKLDKFIERRNKIASVYLKEFENLLTSDYQERFSFFFRFPLMIPDNEEFWKSKIVAYRKGVDSLLTQHLGLEALPNAKLVFDLTVSIPIYPGLPDKDVWTIVNETKKILQL